MRKEDIIAHVQHAKAIKHDPRMTPAEKLAIGDEIRNYVHELHPDWPTEEQRREDLAVHIRVSEALRRVKPSSDR